MVDIKLTSNEKTMAHFALIEYKKRYNKMPLLELKLTLAKVENNLAMIERFHCGDKQETKIQAWCLQQIIENYNSIETLKRNMGAL